MSALRNDVDPDGLLEFSVVFSDRSLNSMSAAFGDVMRDISRILKKAYNAEALAVVPGGGTYGMEAIARQFASNKSTLIIRNGWFSYRWSQILDVGDIAKSQTIIKASQVSENPLSPFSTMNPRILPSNLAQTIAKSAIVPFVIHILAPLRT